MFSRWICATTSPVNFSSPVAIGGYVYGLGPGTRFFCVEAASGKRAWVEEDFFKNMLDQGYASFIVAGPNLLILTERGQLLLVSATPNGCKVLGKATVCGRNWCSPAYTRGLLIIRENSGLVCLRLIP